MAPELKLTSVSIEARAADAHTLFAAASHASEVRVVVKERWLHTRGRRRLCQVWNIERQVERCLCASKPTLKRDTNFEQHTCSRQQKALSTRLSWANADGSKGVGQKESESNSRRWVDESGSEWGRGGGVSVDVSGRGR